MGHNSVMRKLSYKPRSFFHWKLFLGRLAYIQKQHCKYQDKIKVLNLHDRQCKRLKLKLISVCFTEMPALSKKILGMCNMHLSIICHSLFWYRNTLLTWIFLISILKMKQQQHDINLRRTRKKNPSPRWDLNPRPSVI